LLQLGPVYNHDVFLIAREAELPREWLDAAKEALGVKFENRPLTGDFGSVAAPRLRR